VLWPAAEDGAGADGDAGRADTPVLVLVITAAVMVEVEQPAVMAAASRIRPKLRFTSSGRPHGASRFPEATAGSSPACAEGHGTGQATPRFVLDQVRTGLSQVGSEPMAKHNGVSNLRCQNQVRPPSRAGQIGHLCFSALPLKIPQPRSARRVEHY